MKKIVLFLFLIATLIACDDGDVVVTSFDFDDATLQNCGGPGSYVFFKINTNSNESLSLLLGTSDSIFNVADTLSFQLDGSTNFLNYRTFSEAPTASYFCNSIPPTSPTVLQDYIGDDGIATLIVLATLDDNDGIEEDSESNLDTDMDGIPNYYDFDDDGDNVPTAFEIGPDPENPQDTDLDGTPDYLDADDDGDMVPTRYEDTDADLDPRNDITDVTVGADYLNPAVSTETIVDEYVLHSYSTESAINLFLTNVVLTNGEEQLTQESLPFGSINSVFSGTVTITPER
ncbi:hypothetical protein G5B37_01755 [Rasiella rasia]|uniref:Uncharacterized protein n=1 Tax=Rasiella rasia TaxID=2744027 RepID=A0A6G6GIK2_9FLAO|nr:hypothetical protein [Rasiella rasia]QIE58330.1 hypothetical protein G5B37_01755 [Rasiella rasia]